jgi:hypothetical protein
MRLVIDDAIGKLEPEAVRTLKRIERDVSEELAGRLALVAIDPSTPIGSAVERAVKVAGLLGKPERELARAEAVNVLTSIIERDLAYRARRSGHLSGGQTAHAFLALFPGPGARFFTNGELGLSHSLDKTGAWAPLTAATFDTGVVAVEGRKLGVFWVEDED